MSCVYHYHRKKKNFFNNSSVDNIFSKLFLLIQSSMSSPIVAPSITIVSAFYLSILPSTLIDCKSLLIDMVLNKFDTSSFWLLSTSSFSTFSPVSFNCLQSNLFDLLIYTPQLIFPKQCCLTVTLTGSWLLSTFNNVQTIKS